MKTLTAEALAALASSSTLQMLIDMHFNSGSLYLTSSRMDLEDLDSPPTLYTGIGLLGEIGAVEDKTGDIANLTLSLSGVDTSVIAIALGEQVRGGPLRMRLAVLSADTKTVLDVLPLWSGHMSTMQLAQQKNSATVKITAEHRGVLFNRPRPLRYTDADQQRLYPGDRCLEYIISQSQKEDVWPAASFFRT